MALPDALDPMMLARGWTATVPRPVDWAVYRKCGICDAAAGDACRTLQSVVNDGQPAGPPVTLELPHGFRKRRSGR